LFAPNSTEYFVWIEANESPRAAWLDGGNGSTVDHSLNGLGRAAEDLGDFVNLKQAFHFERQIVDRIVNDQNLGAKRKRITGETLVLYWYYVLIQQIELPWTPNRI